MLPQERIKLQGQASGASQPCNSFSPEVFRRCRKTNANLNHIGNYNYLSFIETVGNC